jgi:peroxiredoxin
MSLKATMSLKAALDAFRSEIMAHVPQGGWCPCCNLEPRALQQALPEMTRLGASLVVVSLQTPDESLSTAEKNALAFPLLSDAGWATLPAKGEHHANISR